MQQQVCEGRDYKGWCKCKRWIECDMKHATEFCVWISLRDVIYGRAIMHTHGLIYFGTILNVNDIYTHNICLANKEDLADFIHSRCCNSQ